MDGVKLMSRTDTKFAFPANKLPFLLRKLIPFYSVLVIDGKLIHDYKSLYYDTDDRKFYTDHHNQRVNRNKIRFREYVGSGLTFLEVKLKNNKKRTIKKRIKVNNITKELSEEHKKYIKKILGKKLTVKAKQWINFSRITLVHITQKDRLTIDINLTFENEKLSGDLKHIVIAEVTNPSLGVGYEIGRAIECKKKIVCLFYTKSDNRLSAMIAGSKDIVLFEYSSLNEAISYLDKILI